MLFSEVYGNYFNAIAAVLTRAAEGGLTGKELTAIVQEAAFGESLLTIPAALTDGRWPLLEKDLSTRLHHAPSMPLTALQKQRRFGQGSGRRGKDFGLHVFVPAFQKIQSSCVTKWAISALSARMCGIRASG